MDLYAVLGVDRFATSRELKKAYKERSFPRGLPPLVLAPSSWGQKIASSTSDCAPHPKSWKVASFVNHRLCGRGDKVRRSNLVCLGDINEGGLKSKPLGFGFGVCCAEGASGPKKALQFHPDKNPEGTHWGLSTRHEVSPVGALFPQSVRNAHLKTHIQLQVFFHQSFFLQFHFFTIIINF